MNDLIDEQELRDALEPLRPEADAFEAGVRKRLRSMPQHRKLDIPAFDDSPWLHVAASMVPLSLIGKTASAHTVMPLGMVPLGYKIIGYVALPSISILLMLGATLIAMFKIRKAQVSPASGDADAAKQSLDVLKNWWWSFGLIPTCLSLIALIAFVSGYTFPVFLFFLGSGFAMVALVTRLGQAGIIDRGTVGGSLISSLVGLAQVMQITTIFDSGRHLLDQSLVMLILLLAAILLGLVISLGQWNGRRTFAIAFMLIVSAALIFGFFGQSIWNPMTIHKLQNHVEGFEQSRFSSSSWQHWAVPAVWLQQSGVTLDLSKPKALLEAEMAGEQNPFILGVASRAGLMTSADFARVRDPFKRRKLLLDPYSRDQPITSIGQQEFSIRELAMDGQWNEGELDLLESRLIQTLRYSLSPARADLGDLLIATHLLEAIGRPCNDASIRQQVQLTLVKMQRIEFNLGSRKGGFAAFPTLNHSDLLTTSSAIELMETYGLPPEINLMAIRSFLRPSMTDGWMLHDVALRDAGLRFPARMRLENLLGVSPLTWTDYIRHEPSIAMAIVFALLCFFATLGCPPRVQPLHR
jgi:hypothetical protein